MIKDQTYQWTSPTKAEYQKERERLGRHPSVYFVTCRLDGKRFWYSGLGKGSHERSKLHNSVERALRLVSWRTWMREQSPERVAELDAWAAEHPDEDVAKEWLEGKELVGA